MSLVLVGLGNPGERYTSTRHNVGFALVDRLAECLDVGFKKPLFKRFAVAKARYSNTAVLLVKPLTYMNLSGEILSSLFQYTTATVGDLVVLCDTLDLPLGVCRLKLKGSSGGQKGLESILRVAKTDNIKRLMIGIGRPREKGKVVSYVLGKLSKTEKDILDAALDKAAKSLLRLTCEPLERVINDLNRKEQENSAKNL